MSLGCFSYQRVLCLFLSLTFMHIYFQQVVLTASFLGYVLQLADFLTGGVDVDDGRLVFIFAERFHQFLGIYLSVNILPLFLEV